MGHLQSRRALHRQVVQPAFAVRKVQLLVVVGGGWVGHRSRWAVRLLNRGRWQLDQNHPQLSRLQHCQSTQTRKYGKIAFILLVTHKQPSLVHRVTRQ